MCILCANCGERSERDGERTGEYRIRVLNAVVRTCVYVPCVYVARARA